jgi:FKBP-type peptidyl-prolyl cis-trans isomerase 2
MGLGMKVEKGKIVVIEYEGKLEDGTVFDSSKKHNTPLEFEVGSGKVIPGFDNAVMGMKKGEEKEFSIQPKDAYGEPKKELMKEIPRNVLPQDKEPKEGMMVVMSAPNGQQIPARIAKVTKDTVTLDLNHPLAGKKLIFKIKVIDVKAK